jgi:2-keto-3-deoxy-6-phosphogluconate aldolase
MRIEVPSTCLVGVGTVHHKSEIAEVAMHGGRFALSPIAPDGFIAECLSHGILPVPAAFTPNEVFSLYKVS